MTSQFRLLSMLILILISALYCWSYPYITYESAYVPPYSSVYEFSDYSPRYPTIFGDTGLVLSPTADTTRYLDMNFALDYTQLSIDDGPKSNSIPIRISYGVTPSAELFAFFADGDDETAYNTFGGGAKINLLAERDNACRIPGIAVGARVYRQENTIDRTFVDAYAVASMLLYRFDDIDNYGYRIRGHLGLEYLNVSNDEGADAVTGFAGLSYESNTGSSAVIEYTPEVTDNGVRIRESTISGALRFNLSGNFYLELGGTRPYGIGETSIYTGLMYHVGGRDRDPAGPLPPELSY